MTGTILNGAGILAGGILGLTVRKEMSTATQLGLKALLGVLMVVVGLVTTFTSLGGGVWMVAKQLTILVVSLMLGRLCGSGLRLQKGLNKLGRYAKERLAQSNPANPNRLSEGFITAALLFCLAPIAVIGAVQDGLAGHWWPLALKAALDGLATMALVKSFGWGVILSAIPVVAFQGTVTLGVRLLVPLLESYDLMDSLHAVSGMLVFSVALIILELKRVELADYLPSLAVAPLLAWVWR